MSYIDRNKGSDVTECSSSMKYFSEINIFDHIRDLFSRCLHFRLHFIPISSMPYVISNQMIPYIHPRSLMFDVGSHISTYSPHDNHRRKCRVSVNFWGSQGNIRCGRPFQWPTGINVLLKQRSGLAVQRGNAFSILVAKRENVPNMTLWGISWKHADPLIYITNW